MQKIIIKNFAGIEYAEIEIKKVLVLIGEQASGKSTIAKLIYFFKSLRDNIFSQIYGDDKNNCFDFNHDFLLPTRETFYEFFGSSFQSFDFAIRFYYSVEDNKYLQLTLDKNKILSPLFSSNFLAQSFQNSVTQLKQILQKHINSDDIHEQLAYENLRIKYIKELSILIKQLFKINQTDLLFIIAGRTATVSYSDLFEKYLFASVQNSLQDTRKLKTQEYTIDETLMLKFIERISRIKDKLKRFASCSQITQSNQSQREKIVLQIFDYLSQTQSISLDQSLQIAKIIEKIEAKINQILKGQYIIDNLGERIIIDQKMEKYVYLNNASSGQQESIRILQDIFLTILHNSKVLRIIEEPEAHLFPIAQKQLIELLVLMVNHNEDNQLIITTHSPYILTVFNNLLFAKRVVDKNPSVESEVSQIIPQESWLDANEFSAYSLGNHYWEGEIPYCQSIFNPEQGTIEQNYLDSVSEILGSDFDQLYRIHARSFTRR